MQRKYTIKGIVQGVGYRYFCKKHAIPLGISGSATNLPNGFVEVLAAGEEEKLDLFEHKLREGPRFSEVSSVVTETYTDTIATERFTIH